MEAASQGPGLVVSVFAVLEMAWVLRARKIPRKDVARVIRTLMESEGVTVTHAELLNEALARFESGKADLGECLICADGQAFGAHRFVTFDRVPQEEGWGLALTVKVPSSQTSFSPRGCCRPRELKPFPGYGRAPEVIPTSSMLPKPV
jgi:predicted nucleic-acid-binding protein